MLTSESDDVFGTAEVGLALRKLDTSSGTKGETLRSAWVGISDDNDNDRLMANFEPILYGST